MGLGGVVIKTFARVGVHVWTVIGFASNFVERQPWTIRLGRGMLDLAVCSHPPPQLFSPFSVGGDAVEKAFNAKATLAQGFCYPLL